MSNQNGFSAMFRTQKKNIYIYNESLTGEGRCRKQTFMGNFNISLFLFVSFEFTNISDIFQSPVTLVSILENAA